MVHLFLRLKLCFQKLALFAAWIIFPMHAALPCARHHDGLEQRGTLRCAPVGKTWSIPCASAFVETCEMLRYFERSHISCLPIYSRAAADHCFVTCFVWAFGAHEYVTLALDRFFCPVEQTVVGFQCNNPRMGQYDCRYSPRFPLVCIVMVTITILHLSFLVAIPIPLSTIWTFIIQREPIGRPCLTCIAGFHLSLQRSSVCIGWSHYSVTKSRDGWGDWYICSTFCTRYLFGTASCASLQQGLHCPKCVSASIGRYGGIWSPPILPGIFESYNFDADAKSKWYLFRIRPSGKNGIYSRLCANFAVTRTRCQKYSGGVPSSAAGDLSLAMLGWNTLDQHQKILRGYKGFMLTFVCLKRWVSRLSVRYQLILPHRNRCHPKSTGSRRL